MSRLYALVIQFSKEWDVSVWWKNSKHPRVVSSDSSLTGDKDNLEVPPQGRIETLDIAEIKFKILGRLPNSPRSGELKETRKVNRYLKFQEKRILSCLKDRNNKKAFTIWCSILHRSIGYHMTLLNSVCKGWYWKMDINEFKGILAKTTNKLRRWDLELLVNRFYILKKSGKWRPIGAPSWDSRVISKAFTNMIDAMTAFDRHDMQHGYRRDRGTFSALARAIQLTREGYKIMEFDFKSFFNTVSLTSVYKHLGLLVPAAANVVTHMLANINLRVKGDLKEEKEYELVGDNQYMKSGLPQGLSMSPTLCTLVLENEITPKNLVMYADDGLYFYKRGKDEFSKWIDRLYWMGIKIESSKTGTVDRDFKFLGVHFDLKEATLEYSGSKISIWSDWEILGPWLKTVTQKYGNKPDEGWTWERRENATITYMEKPGLLTCLAIWFWGLWNASMFKGYRYIFGEGIFDIIHSSSHCGNIILKDIRLSPFKLEAYKPLDFETTNAKKAGFQKIGNKNIKIQHIWPPNYAPWTK